MKPVVVQTVADVRRAVAEARGRGKSVGLVPTMGALHDGHLSLVRAARAQAGFVVVSIFVNPAQFGPNEDFTRYPRPLERDLELCAAENVDLVFAPGPDEVYPPGFQTYVAVEELQNVLCGASRPGHFRGVCTVVLKLFNMVLPDVAYFGQKDAQQARIIRQMVRDLDVPVRVEVCPIVREPDGLALSSRSQALAEARQRIEAGERDAGAVRRLLMERIQATPGAVLDYAEVVDADSLRPAGRLQGSALLALAVKFGGTRLIDNALVIVNQ